MWISQRIKKAIKFLTHILLCTLGYRQKISQIDTFLRDFFKVLNHKLHLAQIDTGLGEQLDKIVFFKLRRQLIDTIPDATFHFSGTIHQLQGHVRFAVFCHGGYFISNQESGFNNLAFCNLIYEYCFQLVLLLH